MKSIEINAPAKINIGLFIVSKRYDGYHNLNTLFYPLHSLFDTIKIEFAPFFNFTCSDKNLPQDENNLIVKAVRALEKIKGNSIKVKIELIKRIPYQAGLGGGSSDAAATLISLNEMLNLGLKYEQLIDLSLELGSDVPFFIKAKAAIGKSRGELLEHVDLDIDSSILIVNPQIKISTSEAFQNIAAQDSKFDFHTVINNSKPDYSQLRKNVLNDFEPYVFSKYEEIRNIKETMYLNDAEFALMSGSGSSVFGIFRENQAAIKVRDLMPKNYFCWIDNPEH